VLGDMQRRDWRAGHDFPPARDRIDALHEAGKSKGKVFGMFLQALSQSRCLGILSPSHARPNTTVMLGPIQQSCSAQYNSHARPNTTVMLGPIQQSCSALSQSRCLGCH
jgi:hypothetical protein